MQSTDIPAKFQIPFANNAGGSYIRSVPQASQIGIVAGAASLNDGFVPLNFTPVGSGGVPPFGQDMNGILNQISAWSRWQAAGGVALFDGTFSTAIGGYPKGCLLASSVTAGLFWTSTVENNTTNPDGGSPIGWAALRTGGATIVSASYGVNGYRVWSDGYIEQWGRDTAVENNTTVTHTVNYPISFVSGAFNIQLFRYEFTGNTYNSKHYVRTSNGDANGFNWRIQDDDSGNAGVFVYGFDWRAYGK